MTVFRLVSADWVAKRLDSPDFLVLDPRSAVRYMAGHPKNAVNLSVAKLRDSQGNLLPNERTGAADRQGRPRCASRACDLRQCGRAQCRLSCMDADLSWPRRCACDGEFLGTVDRRRTRGVLPARTSEQREFVANPRSELRTSLQAMQQAAGAKRIDLRGADEFSGKTDLDERPGHIPGAVNLPCQEMGAAGRLLKPNEQLEELFLSHGISSNDCAIAYCRTGVRAALGFLALAQLGFKVSLYDGSYAEWARSGLPVESTFEENEKGERAHG